MTSAHREPAAGSPPPHGTGTISDLDMLEAEFAQLHPGAPAAGAASAPREARAGSVDDDALPAMDGEPTQYEAFYQRVHALDRGRSGPGGGKPGDPIGDGRTALCLSGGGIRSAAFNLGVLQALAAADLLDKFHYLSTVSGGGYIGSWLTLWRRRAGLDAVINGLCWPLRGVRRSAPGGAPKPSVVAPDPIRNLRGKTSYLAPRMGILSSDTWTAIVLYCRNLFLNQLIILPILACAVLLPRLGLLGIEGWSRQLPALMGLAPQEWLPAALAAVSIIGWVVLALARPAWLPPGKTPRGMSRRYAWSGIGVIGFASLIFDLLAMRWPDGPGYLVSLTLPQMWIGGAKIGGATGILAFLVALLASLWAHRKQPPDTDRRPDTRGRVPWVWACTGISGAAVGVLLATGLALTVRCGGQDAARIGVFCLAPLWFALAYLLGDALYLGLSARRTKDRRPGARDPWGDQEREWLARTGGFLLISVVLVSLLSLTDAFADKIWEFAEGDWSRAYTIATGVVSFAGSVLLGASRLTGGNKAQEKPGRLPLQAILVIATPIFIAVLVSGISYGIDLILEKPGLYYLVTGCKPPPSDPVCARPGGAASKATAADNVCVTAASDQGKNVTVNIALSPVPSVAQGPSEACAAPDDGTAREAFRREAIAWAILALVGWFASTRININRFSLHDVYRLRLMREFLGASNPRRKDKEDGWTGFTDTDDDDLANLWHPKGGPEATWKPCLYPVINTTLNLVAANRLAWQERKGEPFVMTPRHVGCARLGYRPTSETAGGVRVSSAMTISGAAVSPNAGYSTVPGLALLMTMFNFRLGAWVGNPSNRKTYRERGPTSALRPLASEALALTTSSDTRYVFLSDGGHYDNLGLYEMLRRRCRYIVVSDAGYDPDFAFEDLGRVVRQAAIDMGIRISFTHLAMAPRPKPGEPPAASDQAYYASAKIIYPETATSASGAPRAATGYLLYIKPGFQNRAEPADVRAFAATNPTFPHDPTVNQFFGESQFESYRALGRYIVSGLLTPSGVGGTPVQPAPRLSKAFRKARAQLRAMAQKTAAAQASKPASTSAATD